jgi:hypothetical protein
LYRIFDNVHELLLYTGLIRGGRVQNAGKSTPVLNAVLEMRKAADLMEVAQGEERLRAFDAFTAAYERAMGDDNLGDLPHLTYILTEAFGCFRSRAGVGEARNVLPGDVHERLNVFVERVRLEVR